MFATFPANAEQYVCERGGARAHLSLDVENEQTADCHPRFRQELTTIIVGIDL